MASMLIIAMCERVHAAQRQRLPQSAAPYIARKLSKEELQRMVRNSPHRQVRVPLYHRQHAHRGGVRSFVQGTCKDQPAHMGCGGCFYSLLF